MNNRVLNIAFVGRLEQEKGVKILIAAIQRWSLNRDITWHICWVGSYGAILDELWLNNIRLYGKKDNFEVLNIMGNCDFTFMPSLFLETFGLVALESWSVGTPVIGFRKGGLIDFIPDTLALDPVEPVESLYRILDNKEAYQLDISNFSYSLWKERLNKITEWKKKILIIHDYTDKIGGAESYVSQVIWELHLLGKQVDFFGYKGKISHIKKILLMISAPIAFWRWVILYKKIHTYAPDLIWVHTATRYIWPWWVFVLPKEVPVLMTHHDLWLVTPKPSQIYSEADIAPSPTLWSWIQGKRGILLIATVIKWVYVRWIWFSIQRLQPIHLLPSAWMVPIFRKYTSQDIDIFPHMIKGIEAVKD